jgi:hypothetical protein
MNITLLGAAGFRSSLRRWVNGSEHLPATIVRTVDAPSPGARGNICSSIHRKLAPALLPDCVRLSTT